MKTVLKICLILALLDAGAARAATYYVRNGGDDAANGLTHDTAWATIDRVRRASFADGDSLLFEEGGHWAGHLIIGWSGTPSTRAIVGSYYLEDGVPTRGYRTERPTIDGEDAIPQQFDGLVRVRGDRVRVENLAVINSEGRGIQFEDSDYAEVVGCWTYNSYKSGIKFLKSNWATARDNIVERAGVAGPEDNDIWGGALELVASDDGLVENNVVLEVFGEGINANHGSARAVIQDNRVHAARAVGIYLDAAPDATVRRNIVTGSSNPDFWRDGVTVGAGIAMNNEVYHYELADGGALTALPLSVQTRGAKIYGNLVAFTSSGVGFWGQLDESSFDDVLVFNNTFVDNLTQVTTRLKPKPGAKFVNNILLSLSPGTRDVDTNDLGGMTAKSNYFSEGDPGGDYTHPGNRFSGLALTRMSGWHGVGGLDDIDWHDFALADGSAAIAAGDDEPVLMSQGDNTFNLDFNGYKHNSPMDMGALHFSPDAIKTPKRPTDVVGTPH